MAAQGENLCLDAKHLLMHPVRHVLGNLSSVDLHGLYAPAHYESAARGLSQGSVGSETIWLWRPVIPARCIARKTFISPT